MVAQRSRWATPRRRRGLRLTGQTADHFCGGGGVSWAIRKVTGRSPHYAINHDDTAIAVHKANHPDTQHHRGDMVHLSPRRHLKLKKGDLWFFWTSPDCRDFSNAKGGRPRNQKIRCLAWTAVRWARDLMPDLFFLENVREFTGWGPLDANGDRIPARKGETFRRWVRELEALGYKVEWRVLNAADYGVPQNRRRLFIVARRDGKPIVWPAPTHGPGLKPYRTAAECIDFSRKSYSIFLTKRQAKKIFKETGVQLIRPLSKNTMWRIAEGIRRFVRDDPDPFIVKVAHGKRDARVERLDRPMSTVTASRREAALVMPVLVQTGHGERKGQRARVLNLHKPLGAVVATAQNFGLVSAFLSKAFGDPRRKKGGGRVIGMTMKKPFGTVTTRDHHQVVSAHLVKLYGTSTGARVAEPMPTVTAGGYHIAEVRAFLTAYYGEDGAEGKGQDLRSPMRTLPTKARFGLVTVHGIDYQIVDICFRMVEWDELANAQFTPELAALIDLSGAKTKEKKTQLIGNSVPPLLAEAVIRANTKKSARPRRNGQLELRLAA